MRSAWFGAWIVIASACSYGSIPPSARDGGAGEASEDVLRVDVCENNACKLPPDATIVRIDHADACTFEPGEPLHAEWSTPLVTSLCDGDCQLTMRDFIVASDGSAWVLADVPQVAATHDAWLGRYDSEGTLQYERFLLSADDLKASTSITGSLHIDAQGRLVVLVVQSVFEMTPPDVGFDQYRAWLAVYDEQVRELHRKELDGIESFDGTLEPSVILQSYDGELLMTVDRRASHVSSVMRLDAALAPQWIHSRIPGSIRFAAAGREGSSVVMRSDFNRALEPFDSLTGLDAEGNVVWDHVLDHDAELTGLYADHDRNPWLAYSTTVDFGKGLTSFIHLTALGTVASTITVPFIHHPTRGFTTDDAGSAFALLVSDQPPIVLEISRDGRHCVRHAIEGDGPIGRTLHATTHGLYFADEDVIGRWR